MSALILFAWLGFAVDGGCFNPPCTNGLSCNVIAHRHP